MYQVFEMILWAKPQDASIEEMTDISYQLLSELHNYGSELAPKYLPAWRKDQVREFELNKNNIKELLEKNVNKEGGRVFWDLGRSLSFFSSKNESNSSEINIQIGVSNASFNNLLVVSLPYVNFSGFDTKKIEFENLFKKLISIFNPYFAFISNSFNKQLSDEFWKDDKPTYVHWMNYYDESTTQNIGRDKILTLDGITRLDNGYFYKLQDELFDAENHKHLLHQQEVSKSLRLI